MVDVTGGDDVGVHCVSHIVDTTDVFGTYVYDVAVLCVVVVGVFDLSADAFIVMFIFLLCNCV